MLNMKAYFLVLITSCIWSCVLSQSLSDDKRCKCICPKVSTVTNNTEIVDAERIRYVDNVPPNKCNCMDLVIPKIANKLNGKEGEFCPRCQCKYENRNTTIIKVVVIIVIAIISILIIYMAFLIILDPVLNKRMKGSYQEHTNEERRKKKYRQSRFHNVEELTSLLEASDHDEVIENEDTLEMVYLPLEDYRDDNSSDNDIARNVNKVPKLNKPYLTKNVENICGIKNGDQKLILSIDSGIEETVDPVVSGVKDFNKMTLTVKTAQEEDVSSPGSTSHDMTARGNVLNRVGHQQDKWKRQVREQRRNIYDRHAMLN